MTQLKQSLVSNCTKWEAEAQVWHPPPPSLLSSRGFRSAGSGYDILTLISVASDLYGKLSYDDLDCQKKIICEFMDEPEMFGSGASKVKTGVEYAAAWLAPMGFTIVDQISEAAMLDSQV